MHTRFLILLCGSLSLSLSSFADISALDKKFGVVGPQKSANTRSKEAAAPVVKAGAAASKEELKEIQRKLTGLKCKDSDSRWAQKRILQLIPLILQGEDVDYSAPDMKGNTCLHYACELGSRQLIHWLVENGADVNRVEYGGGNTPLHNAARLASLHTVTYLLEHGANPNVRNVAGDLPCDVVGKDDHDAIVAKLQGSEKTSLSLSKTSSGSPESKNELLSLSGNLLRNTPLPYQFTLEREDMSVQPVYNWLYTSSPKDVYVGMEGHCLKTEGRVGGYDTGSHGQINTTLWDARTLLPVLCKAEKSERRFFGGGSSSISGDSPHNDNQNNTTLLANRSELKPLLLQRSGGGTFPVFNVDVTTLTWTPTSRQHKPLSMISRHQDRSEESWECNYVILGKSNSLNGFCVEQHREYGLDVDTMPETHYILKTPSERAWLAISRQAIEYPNSVSGDNQPLPYRAKKLDSETASRIETNSTLLMNQLIPIQGDRNLMGWIVGTHDDCQLYVIDTLQKSVSLVHEWMIKGTPQWDEQLRRLAIPLEENFFEVYDLGTSQPEPSLLYRMVTGSEGQYAIVLPDGRYAGSPGCERLMNYHNGGVSVGMASFAPWLNRPGEVIRELGGDSRVADILSATTARWLKKIGVDSNAEMPKPDELARVKVTLPKLMTDSPVLRLPLTLKAAKRDVSEIVIKVDGNQLKNIAPAVSVKGGEEKSYEINVPLAHGQNWIELIPVDANGVQGISERFRVIRSGESTRRRFVVALGVSHYKELGADLKYAAKDAKDIARAFAEIDPSLTVKTLVLTDEEVTRDCVSRITEFLRDTTEDDEVILFCAGHGVRDDQLNYYYCSHEFDADHPVSTGISMESLIGAIGSASAHHKLVFLDTCHAGNVGEEDEEQLASSGNLVSENTLLATRGLRVKKAESANLMELKRSEENEKRYIESVFSLPGLYNGMNIITAVSGAGLSLEDDSLGNGVFSKSIIECLNEGLKGDTNRDAALSVSELFNSLQKRVPILSEQVLKTACQRKGLDYLHSKDSLPAPMVPSVVSQEYDQNFALLSRPIAPNILNTNNIYEEMECPFYFVVDGRGRKATDGAQAPSFMLSSVYHSDTEANFYWPLGDKSLYIHGRYALVLYWETETSGNATIVDMCGDSPHISQKVPFSCADARKHPDYLKCLLHLKGYIDPNYIKRGNLDAISRDLLDFNTYFAQSSNFKSLESRHYAGRIAALIPGLVASKNWEIRGPSSNSVLHYTAALGNQKMTKWLVEHGANVNARNADGQTPLDCLGVNKSGLDKWLIQRGAQRTHEIRKGDAVLMEYGRTDYAEEYDWENLPVEDKVSEYLRYDFDCDTAAEIARWIESL